MTLPQTPAGWRKSSHSTETNSCVEVARGSHSILVRDTKQRQAGHLTVQDKDWRSFLAAVKDGQIER